VVAIKTECWRRRSRRSKRFIWRRRRRICICVLRV